MNLIVAADKDFCIGKNNGLLANIPEDMKFFRETTSGKIIVMGSKTYLSFPKRPLPNRENLVITKNPENYPEVRTFTDIESFLSYAKTAEKEIFVCGGGMIYKSLLPYCKKAYITKIDYSFGGDTFFPDIDSMENWRLTEESEEKSSGGYNFRFTVYENTDPITY